MKCPNCDKTLSDKQIKEAKRRQKSLNKQPNAMNYNIYCDMKCFYEFKGMKRGGKKARICPECGGKKGKESMRCGDCRSIAVSEYRLDSDVKELVVLNSGCFDYFIDMVFGRGGTANNRRERRSRLYVS